MENKEETKTTRSNDEIIADIKHVLEKNIAPSVLQHGGEVSFLNYNDGNLKLMMSGACSGCAGSQATLKFGIENMMKHYVPEVKEISGEDDEKSTVDPYYERWAGFND